MDWFWTWGGECFGYRSDDGLFTYNGCEVGRFDGQEVYGSDGSYLGEVMSGNRLITNLPKKNWVRAGFLPRTGGSYVRYVSYVGYVMYAGYGDIPGPDNFRYTCGAVYSVRGARSWLISKNGSPANWQKSRPTQ